LTERSRISANRSEHRDSAGRFASAAEAVVRSGESQDSTGGAKPAHDER